MQNDNMYTEVSISEVERQAIKNRDLINEFTNIGNQNRLIRENKNQLREFYDLLNKKEIGMKIVLNNAKEEYESQLLYNNQLRDTNYKLNNELHLLNQKFEDLSIKFQTITKKKKQLNDEIMGLRKESIGMVDYILRKKGMIDSTIKKMQKELNLLMNFLKVRIINTGSLEEKKEIKAYLINIDKGLIKPFIAILTEPERKRIIEFWSEMYKFLDLKNTNENVPNNQIILINN